MFAVCVSECACICVSSVHVSYFSVCDGACKCYIGYTIETKVFRLYTLSAKPKAMYILRARV